ncbi:MAG: archaeosortase/exosortase family protein [Candidatus Altiarchaeota archaeon]
MHVEMLLKSVIVLVVLFEGFRILLLPSYHARALGAVMLAAGYVLVRRDIPSGKGKKSFSILPLAGVLVVFGDLFYNIVVKDSTQFLGLDWMTIMFGGMLIAYNFIPAKYATETRFLTIFLGLFFISLSLPLAVLSMKVSGSAGSHYTSAFIARPLATLLKLYGVKTSWVGNWVYYSGLKGVIRLGIGISCSGAYSFAIFFSAFTAYVHVRYARLDKKIVFLLLAGLAGTYAANLLRVFMIALVGYYYGEAALISAHKNLGWIIFMAWVTLFWYIGFRIFYEGKTSLPRG